MMFAREFVSDYGLAAPAHLAGAIVVTEHFNNSRSHLRVIAATYNEPGLAFNDRFAYAANICCHDRQSDCHVFENRIGETFGFRTQHADMRSKQQSRDIITTPDEVNVFRYAHLICKFAQARHQFTFAGDHKRRVWNLRAHPRRGMQEHLVILNWIAQVCDDGHEALTRFRQSEFRARRLVCQTRPNFHPIEVESVVMLNDSLRIDALANQHVLHDQAVRDDAIGQPRREPLDAFLHRRAKTVGLAFRCQPRNAREISADHSEDVCVEAVRVNYVDPILFDVADKSAQLLQKIPIIETSERIFMNLSNAQFLSLCL